MTVQTSSGGTLSIISLIIIVILFLNELSTYISVTSKDHMIVDTKMGEKLKISFDITFHSLRCSVCHFDVMDVSGVQQLDSSKHIFRRRITADGSFIGEEIDGNLHEGTSY
jgi:hypothetical protein